MVPKNLNFPLTYKCNSKCRMCHVWDRKDKNNEFTAEQFENFLFKIPLFNENIELISFTGGEFCLKDDALQIIDRAFFHIKKLKEATFLSNGLSENKLLKLIKDISELKTAKSIKKTIFISIDGIGESHDINRGIPGSYKKSMHTLSQLIELLGHDNDFKAGILSTIGPDNYNQAPALIEKASEMGISISFQFYRDDAYFCNEQEKLYIFTDDERKKLLNTFKFIFNQLGNESSLTAVDNLSGKKRKQRCFHILNGFLLTPKGHIYPCGVLEKDSFFLGNIAENHFEDIWNKKISSQFIKRMMEHKCMSCPIALGSANYHKNFRYYYLRTIFKISNLLGSGIPHMI